MTRAMAFLWAYDIVKFLAGFKFMDHYSINPWLFFFLDMVTVPTYVLGWRNLAASLAGEVRTFKSLFKWSAITFVSSTAPYCYAAWAGRQSFPKQAWLILILILVFFLVTGVKKICQAKKTKKKIIVYAASKL